MPININNIIVGTVLRFRGKRITIKKIIVL
jgi:hypothetical protein